MIDLGTLRGHPRSHATAVNDNGQVVGLSSPADGLSTRAFSWTQAGGMVDLGTLGGSVAHALAVNETGQVVGQSTQADGSFHAVLWEVPAAVMVHDLSTSIDSMELQPGVTDSLASKLDDASAAVVAGDATACGDLQALINYATARIGRKLTPDQGTPSSRPR